MDGRVRARVRGCIIGTAVGDALGAPVEFLSAAQIAEQYGSPGIVGLERWGDHPAGAYTDDTQMTRATAEGVMRSLRDGVDTTAAIWEEYLRWLETQDEPAQRRGPGSTCLSALRDGEPGDLTSPVNQSKGCGGVMRVAPVGLAFGPGWAFELGSQSAALTHGHPSGYLAAGFLADVVSRLVRGTASFYRAIAETREELLGWEDNDEVLGAVDAAVELAMTSPGTRLEVDRLGEGWVAEEALAIALACALAYPEDWRAGVLLAVNHGGDSDSTGAMTGALLGAHLGVDAIPYSWVAKVEDSADLLDVADRLADVVAGEPDYEWLDDEAGEQPG